MTDRVHERPLDVTGAQVRAPRQTPVGGGAPSVSNRALSRLAAHVGGWADIVRRNNGLVKSKGDKYKKKAKEREEQQRLDVGLDKQVRGWLSRYGHAQALHVAMTTAALDARNRKLATTFETADDLLIAAKTVISDNEDRLNHWYANTTEPRITLTTDRPTACVVRGRRKLDRPAWHHKQAQMPPHPGFGDVDADDLDVIVGVFDRDEWSGAPLGLVTCYPTLAGERE